MRNSNAKLYKNKNNIPCLLMLEAGYCAEHEEGIQPLYSALGITPIKTSGPTALPRDYQGPWGVDAIIAQPNFPQETISLIEKKETKKTVAHTYLHVSTTKWEIPEGTTHQEKITWIKKRHGLLETNKAELERIPSLKEFPHKAAWSRNGFYIATRDPETQVFLRELHQILTNLPEAKKLAVWLGGAGNNPFGRDGLVLALVEKIDQDNNEQMIMLEKENHRIHWLAQDTGIPALIPKSHYYALHPGYVLKSRNDRGTLPMPITTEQPVMFFLNPTDQKNNHSGWFTCEELKDWFEGKPNPITKTQESQLITQ